MTNMSNTGMTLADFERLLDVYGGDRTRWPAEARAAAAQLVARDAKARRMLAEAEVLDRVLERAPLPSLAVEAALAERIVAAAQRSPRIVKIASGQSSVVSLPDGRGTAAAAIRILETRILRGDVRAAALLAASLMVGIFIGISNVPQSVVPALADLAGPTGAHTVWRRSSPMMRMCCDAGSNRYGKSASPALDGDCAFRVSGTQLDCCWGHSRFRVAPQRRRLRMPRWRICRPICSAMRARCRPRGERSFPARTEEQRQNVRPLRRQLREAREEAVTGAGRRALRQGTLSGGAIGVA